MRWYASGRREGGQQVVLDAADVEFGQIGRRGCGLTSAISLSFVRRTSWRASKLKSSAVGFDPRLRPPDGAIQQVVGGDQVLIDGVAKVRQIDAAEGPVPVAAIALAAV